MDILFDHPLTNRNLNPAEKAWLRYVVESVRRASGRADIGYCVVNIHDRFNESLDEMVYLLDVRWDFPLNSVHPKMAKSSASGSGVTPGDALSELLATFPDHG